MAADPTCSVSPSTMASAAVSGADARRWHRVVLGQPIQHVLSFVREYGYVAMPFVNASSSSGEAPGSPRPSANPVVFEDIRDTVKRASILAEEVWRIGHRLATAPEERDTERDTIVLGALSFALEEELELIGRHVDHAQGRN
jgi:hypothetical protein